MDEIKKIWHQLKDGTKTMFKEFFNKETNKKQRANMWTFSRLIIAFIIPIVSAIAAITSSVPLIASTVALTGIGAMTDFFDGRSARRHHSTSEFGKLLDPITDKIFSLMVGLSLALFNPLFLIPLVGEAAITGVNTYYKTKHKINVESTLIGKIKQFPLGITFGLGFLSALVPSITIVTNIMLALTTLMQCMTLGSYIKENNKKVANQKLNTKEIEIKEKKEDEKELTVTKRKEEYLTLRNLLIDTYDEENELNELDDIKRYIRKKRDC
jgi:CDP-diacylglycerol--glycerol-3-phosphate 3-phosphatidyltransferase